MLWMATMHDAEIALKTLEDCLLLAQHELAQLWHCRETGARISELNRKRDVEAALQGAIDAAYALRRHIEGVE